MARDSRIKKSLLNARVNLICYFISLTVAFFTRKVFLDQLGTEFVGFTGTLQSLLGFLNLAELGVGSAIGYVLYKPIFDNDQSKINEIISVFGYLYRYIGLFIISAGVILSFFLPLIFSDTNFSWDVIYFGFYAYLASSMLGYFVNYRQILLSADQRNYEVMGYYQAVVSSKMILQMALAIFVQSFTLYLANELVFGIIYSTVLSWRINKVYPWLESNVKLGKNLFKKYPEIGKYVKQLFAHKVGEFVQGQITPLLIYSYVSLPMVAIYGNYFIFTNKIQGFLRAVLNSTDAGVGNLISEGDKNKIWATYKGLFSVRALAAGIIVGCTYFLISAFINNWLGANFILNKTTVLLICIQLYLSIMRGTNDQFLFGYGLFYDVWAPIVEALIFVISAMIGGSFLGLDGILLGPIFSLSIIVLGWKPYFLFSRGFKVSVVKFWGLFVFNLIVLIGSFLASYCFCTKFLLSTASDSWGALLINTVSFFVIILFVYSFILYFLIPDFKYIIFKILKFQNKS
jgi:O-antigen/teichoic acid export membrane protein